MLFRSPTAVAALGANISVLPGLYSYLCENKEKHELLVPLTILEVRAFYFDNDFIICVFRGEARPLLHAVPGSKTYKEKAGRQHKITNLKFDASLEPFAIADICKPK